MSYDVSKRGKKRGLQSGGRRGSARVVPLWQRVTALVLTWAMVFELTPAQAIRTFAYANDLPAESQPDPSNETTATTPEAPAAETNTTPDPEPETSRGGGIIG